ncbi:hypothetical protein [Sphingorhabdus sp.]|uniref:hypothetical protein n=1 Tax=Sphingorhabdus sp. TaxID=1902408 RepID=UPI0032B7AFD8
MTGWILALAAAASSTPTPPPARVQAIGTATVTIVQLERIDFSKPAERKKEGAARQSGTRDGAPQIDFY